MSGFAADLAFLDVNTIHLARRSITDLSFNDETTAATTRSVFRSA